MNNEYNRNVKHRNLFCCDCLYIEKKGETKMKKRSGYIFDEWKQNNILLALSLLLFGICSYNTESFVLYLGYALSYLVLLWSIVLGKWNNKEEKQK